MSDRTRRALRQSAPSIRWAMAMLAASVLALTACHASPPAPTPQPTPTAARPGSTAAPPGSTAAMPESVAITPELHARLVPIVAEVKVREVHPVAALSWRDPRGKPVTTGQSGRLVVMDVVRLLKGYMVTTLIAIVPDALDLGQLDPNLPADPLAQGDQAIVFLTHYQGLGDVDCANLIQSMGGSGQILCGFGLAYVIDGASARNPLTGQDMALAELEGAVQRGVRPRRPPAPDPLPEPRSQEVVDGVWIGLDGALLWSDGVVAEVEVVHAGPVEFNTPSGEPPPGPPDVGFSPHVDRDDWDISQVVELRVHTVYAGDPTLTDIVTLVPGEPDNPYNPRTGMEPPPLPAGMRGVVAFTAEIWPDGDPTPFQRRAMARVDALNAAGRHARLLMPLAGAGAAYFVGPYAIEDHTVRRIPELRAHLRSVVQGSVGGTAVP